MVETMAGIMLVLLSSVLNTAYAADEKALRAERYEAQKQRQQQKNERQNKIRESFANFRNFARELNLEYKEKSRSLEMEYRLQRVELKAQRDMKIADAEANMQQQLSQLFINPQTRDNREAIDKLRADMKIHADKVFEIKKQAAEIEHREFIDNENRKHKLLSERDQKALDKARALGLLDKHSPILARPIGGKLTRQEEQWNEKEKIEVEKLYKSNQRQLAEFIYGVKLREWEIANKQSDFKLEWDKKSELHDLNQEQALYNMLLLNPAGYSEGGQKEISEKMTDMSKRSRMINIKYKKINDQNRIKRSEERRKIRNLE